MGLCSLLTRCALWPSAPRRARRLIWTNPRFAHLDTCDTWDEAVAGRQFRFKDLVDPASGVKLLELEHETRSVRHFQFYKDVAY